LIRLAARQPTWVLGFQAEVWWGRPAQPARHGWAAPTRPLRLVERAVAEDAPDPTALACSGLRLRSAPGDGGWREATWLRFVDGRPLGAATTASLARGRAKLQAAGEAAWLLAWDNAPRHVSRPGRAWIHAHHRRVKWSGRGVRISTCYLPIKSPGLNPIAPRWAHAKRRVVEPARRLSADELSDRVYAAFGCDPHPALVIPATAA
jgi:hypothetical protein